MQWLRFKKVKRSNALVVGFNMRGRNYRCVNIEAQI